MKNIIVLIIISPIIYIGIKNLIILCIYKSTCGSCKCNLNKKSQCALNNNIKK